MTDGQPSLKARLLLNFKENKFAWIMSFIFILFWLAQIINGRFTLSDFEVQYSAGKNLLSGKPIYGIPFGCDHCVYKYSPITLFFLLPYSFLPFVLACTIHFFFVATIIVYTVIYLDQFIREIYFNNVTPGLNKILFLSVLIVGLHFSREVHLGNWNVHLLILAILSLRLILRNHEVSAGTILAWVLLMKPHFVILLPLLLMRGKIKTFAAAVMGIFLGLNIPALFLGFKQNVELNMQWFRTLLDHNASFVRDENSLFWLLHTYLIKQFHPEISTFFSPVVVFMVALLFMLFVMSNFRYEKGCSNKFQGEMVKKDFVFEYFLLLAILPSITVTDSEHFLWSLPIIIFLLSSMVYRLPKRSWVFSFLIVAFLFYGGNIYEVWGRNLSVRMSEAGVVGIGNLLIIGGALFIFSKIRTDDPYSLNPL